MTAETLEFVRTDKPDDDAAPPTSFEYACETCAKEIYYGGRGRKPRFCEEHKPNKAARGKGSGSNAQLARQASEVLVQVNAFLAIGLMLPPLQLTETASALAEANDGFGVSAYEALLTDPGLAKLILRGGGASGKLALVLAYVMLGGSVVPVGVNEFRERKANADRSEVA